MENNNLNSLFSIVQLGGAALIASSFWVVDNKVAVNRRYVGLLLIVGGGAAKVIAKK